MGEDVLSAAVSASASDSASATDIGGGLQHQFVGVHALSFVLLVCLSLSVGYWVKKYRFYYVPESSAAMLLGFLVGGIVLLISQKKLDVHYVMFQPEVFFFILLPPIIFDAGYRLQNPMFFSNLVTIGTFAVFGTVVSTVIIGYGLYYLAILGFVPLDQDSPLEALIFGALISAVDPVATLSVLANKHVNADPLLTAIVFGESVLNDAVSIVLFNTLKSFVGKDLQDLTFVRVGIDFLTVSIGSLMVGVSVALACAYVLKQATNLRDMPSYEFSLITMLSYATYCMAEIGKMSGVMALFFCGIAMGHYAYFNLSKTTQTSTTHAYASFALIAETFLVSNLTV
jgi:solute carrier family 9 (sodium/hydrogen exchanger), member 8